MSDELLRQHDKHVTRLTLNRPQKANALSASLVEALLDAIDYAATDGTRLLILEGTGAHFCAGFDFSEMQARSEGDLALRFVRIETLLQALYHAPYETLALHRVVSSAPAPISSRAAACGLPHPTPRSACPDCGSASSSARAGWSTVSARIRRATSFRLRAPLMPAKL